MIIDKELIRIIRGVMTIKGSMKNGLYVLDGMTTPCNATSLATSTNRNTQLWHLRLEHINNMGMEELSKRDMFHGDKINGPKFYESCILRKSHKVKFSKGIHNTKGVLEYFHREVWCTAHVQSKDGEGYFLSFIDYYSKRVWVLPLRIKNWSFISFKEWKVIIEN